MAKTSYRVSTGEWVEPEEVHCVFCGLPVGRWGDALRLVRVPDPKQAYSYFVYHFCQRCWECVQAVCEGR